MLNHQHKQHFSFPLLQNVLKDIDKVQVFEELIPFLWEQASKDVIFENHLQPSMPVVTIKKVGMSIGSFQSILLSVSSELL